MERRVAVGLYLYRLAGSILFLVTDERAVLFLFPNVFEPWFIFVAAIYHLPAPLRWTRPEWQRCWRRSPCSSSGRSGALHVGQVFESMTSVQFLEEIWLGLRVGRDGPSRSPAPLAPRYALGMDATRIVDVTDAATFGILPLCADPSFDHRTCDYWEEADRGSKVHRASWLRTGETSGAPAAPRPVPSNPFLADLEARDDNPFALKRSAPINPFALDDDDVPPVDNPFAPKRAARPTVGPGAAPKLSLLGRGLAVFGSYAKVLLVEEAAGERAVAYAQFGPLSAYPRALRLRELYPRSPRRRFPRSSRAWRWRPMRAVGVTHWRS